MGKKVKKNNNQSKNNNKNKNKDKSIYTFDPDFELIIKKYNLKQNFEKNVEEEISNFENFKISKEEIAKRKDLRNLFTITMDSINAKDFDDAYSLNYNDGIWTLWVHIADVSFFVKKDSFLDKEAMERGNSYYLGPWVIHMLPPILSENLCSLKENEDRLTVTCEMKLDEIGNLLEYKIYRSIINVNKRIPYEIGNKILEEKENEYFEFLNLSAKLQRILYNNRIKKGSIDFNFPEYIFIFKKSFITPYDIIKYERGICERIIEEFMLCANKVVATVGSKLNDFIFRIHDKPDNLSKIDRNIVDIKNLSHNEINSILKMFKNSDKQYAVETMILKSLKRANYDNKNIGHFGLNFEKYTHFTSPIRRYSDLITHRLILNETYSSEELKRISIITSLKEQIATEAEEEYNKIKNARFLEKFVNKNFNVNIVGIIPKGVFCRIEKYGCEGLIDSKILKKEGYIYDKKNNIFKGKNKKKILEIGKKIEVKLIKSDIEKGFIDFAFTHKAKEKKNAKNKKKRRNSGRHDPIN